MCVLVSVLVCSTHTNQKLLLNPPPTPSDCSGHFERRLLMLARLVQLSLHTMTPPTPPIGHTHIQTHISIQYVKFIYLPALNVVVIAIVVAVAISIAIVVVVFQV